MGGSWRCCRSVSYIKHRSQGRKDGRGGVGAVGGRERRGVRDGGLGEEIAEGRLRDEGGLEFDEELERVSRGRNKMDNGRRGRNKGLTHVMYLLRRGAVELAVRHVVQDDFVTSFLSNERGLVLRTKGLTADPTPPSPSSTASTPSSIQSTNTDTVVKTLAERLSFWTRLSKRKPTGDHTLVEQPEGAGLEPEELESLVKDESQNPEEVIESIVSSAAPPPQTTEEKHSELEEKIIRECIREYTRGGMYFAHSFGE